MQTVVFGLKSCPSSLEKTSSLSEADSNYPCVANLKPLVCKRRFSYPSRDALPPMSRVSSIYAHVGSCERVMGRTTAPVASEKTITSLHAYDGPSASQCVLSGGTRVSVSRPAMSR